MLNFFFYKNEFGYDLKFECYMTMDEIRAQIFTECNNFLKEIVLMHIEIIKMCSEPTIAVNYYRSALRLIESYEEKKLKIDSSLVNKFY